MVASVIPSIRTPRGVDIFEYDVPDEMTIETGRLVWIPFRSKRIVGLVHDIREDATTNKPRKPIEATYAGLRFGEGTLRLLDALAIRSLTSTPSVLHAWLGTLPKKPRDVRVRPVQASLMATREERYLLNHWLGDRGVIETAKKASKDKQRVLILTPWASREAWLSDRCDAALLTSDLAAGARFKAWTNFLRGDTHVLVATRVGAWLAAEADLVILDEPENDDHKQDELAPRFDVRWMVENAGTSLVSIGLTPRLSALRSPTIPTLEPRLAAVDIHRADWSPISGLQRRTVNIIEESRKEGRETYIIHPIHGDRARIRCADCGWTAVCARCGAGLTVKGRSTACARCHMTTETTLTCPACGGQDLSKSRPGRERLEKDLQAHGLGGKVHVLSIGEWNDLTSIPTNSLVILTDLSLLPGYAGDVRRRERLIIAFRRLADACQTGNADLVVQSDPLLLAEAKSWLTTQGCRDALLHEATERAQFHLPPSVRLVKIIVRDSGSSDDLLTTLRPRIGTVAGASLSGPYPVLFRSSTRTGRSIIHLSVPANTPDSTIVDALQPFVVTNALIDLDPIAFFE